MSESLAYHDSLNPVIWNEYDRIIPEIKTALNKIANKFIQYLDIDSNSIEDIILTGSNCNYNWTEYSDIDLHIVVDMNALDCEGCMIDIDDCFRAKKSLWNDRHDITIKGHEVELYVQDASQTEIKNSGVYSLHNEKWITKPVYDSNIQYDEVLIRNKSDMLANQIIDVLNDHSDEKLNKIKELNQKISNYRKAGLTKEGEFSLENLVFKTLRNRGLIDKLRDSESKVEDKELSVEGSVPVFNTLQKLIIK